AGSFAKELEKLADDLTDLARSHQKTQAALMKKAQEALPDGVRVTDDLGPLVAQARNMTLQQTAEVTAARAAVENLQLRMEARKKLEAEIDTQRSQHKIYAALGNELKSDRIVQFLQAEALEALSVAASRHLLDLSSTRFRLAYEQDRFYVIDAWNGDERRNVKTLSGGETFLASLALALALSEQVQLLAVVERSRLDSLFLDEGFGTLDAETLEVVVSAIEQLGDTGRLVGVITHVQELADRLPVKIQITKSPRGSTVSRAEPAPIGL
ncbi:MAG: repair protein SbcC/Rad50, partial [Actinomycetota bacterium]|nr:repair protein SbcC/Rad50 [Actinomycetota bacterium]